MWWKTRYPDAKVIAFEADPEILQILQKNCSHLSNVQMVNAAIWDKGGNCHSPSKATWAVTWRSLDRAAAIILSRGRLRLRSFLADKCSFLKMDIEGAETEVFRDGAPGAQKCGSRLY